MAHTYRAPRRWKVSKVLTLCKLVKTLALCCRFVNAPDGGRAFARHIIARFPNGWATCPCERDTCKHVASCGTKWCTIVQVVCCIYSTLFFVTSWSWLQGRQPCKTLQPVPLNFWPELSHPPSLPIVVRLIKNVVTATRAKQKCAMTELCHVREVGRWR